MRTTRTSRSSPPWKSATKRTHVTGMSQDASRKTSTTLSCDNVPRGKDKSPRAFQRRKARSWRRRSDGFLHPGYRMGRRPLLSTHLLEPHRTTPRAFVLPTTKKTTKLQTTNRLTYQIPPRPLRSPCNVAMTSNTVERQTTLRRAPAPPRILHPFLRRLVIRSSTSLVKVNPHQLLPMQAQASASMSRRSTHHNLTEKCHVK